ncbi:hypothetical protein [Nocardiopsis alba]|uniref:hypothetical protein n=1 Tax=Nocardiopsis alba TaxID=53437 RepID=UPI003682108E
MTKQPREYLRWDLLDRSEDPVPWVTSDVRSLSRFYEKLSDAAEQAAADMRRLESDRLGEGDTVDALKELVNELPKYLDKAQSAYESGYRALDKWETSLETARADSATIARAAAEAYLALEDTDAWKNKVDGDDPVRQTHIVKLERLLDDMQGAADECARALEEAKQGSPRKLWGWLDKIVTWVEENPLLYAVAMVVAGLAAIFIPGLGIALALVALSISGAGLFKEGKLGFNKETLFTLGMDAVSLIPGGALLRGGRAVGRVAGQAATRVPGRAAGGVRSAATAVRNSRGVTAVTSRAGRVSRRVNDVRSRSVTADIGYNIAKDSATSMGASITVQVAGEGVALSDISLGHEALTALGTSAAGSTVGALKSHDMLPSFGGSGSGGDGGTGVGTGGGDPAPDPVGSGAAPEPASGGGDTGGPGGDTNTGGSGTGSGDSSNPSNVRASDPGGPGTTAQASFGAPDGVGGTTTEPAAVSSNPDVQISSDGTTSESTGGPSDTGGAAQSGPTNPSTSETGPATTGSPDASTGAPAGGGAPESGPSTSTSTAANTSDGGVPTSTSSPEPTGGSTAEPTVASSAAPTTTDSTGSPENGAADTSVGGGTTRPPEASDGAPVQSDAGGPPAGTVGAASDSTTGDGAPATGSEPNTSDRGATSETSGDGGTTDRSSDGEDTSARSDAGEGRRSGEEPREDFAPVTRSGGGTPMPQPSARPRSTIADVDGMDTSSTGRSTTADPEASGGDTSGPRADGDTTTTGSPTGSRTGGDDTTTGAPPPIDTPPAARPDETAVGSGTPRRETVESHGNGSYTTTRDANGEPTVSYRHPTPGDGPDFTMDVTRDRVTVGDRTVTRSENGFGVTTQDGSGATVSRGARGESGTVEVTGPEGRPGASYRDGRLTVPTGQGDVTVSRNDQGATISASDGLSVTRPTNDDPTRIVQEGGPVDLRFGGDGPEITRPDAEGGSTPRTRVSDPAGGRSTEIGLDGYRVDTDGSTQSYDRGTDTVTLDSGSTRASASPGDARVSDESRGVDLWRSRDGIGTARGAGATAVGRGDGGFDIRAGEASPQRATRDADGTVTVGDTRITFDEPGCPDGVVRTGSGSEIRVVDVDGRPGLRVTAPDGTTSVHGADGAGRAPSIQVDGHRIALDPNSPDGSDVTLQVDTPGGWRVDAAGADAAGVRTPPDADGNSLEMARRADGTNEMGSGDFRVVSTPAGDGSSDVPSWVSAHGPDGITAGSSRDEAHVGDGTTRTEVEPGDSRGLGSARTRSEGDDPTTHVSQGNEGGRVRTGDGTDVHVEGDRVGADVPRGSEPDVRSGDRTIEVRDDRVDMRGPDPETGGPTFRPGEHAGDAGRVPPRWRASTDGESMGGGTHPLHEITTRPQSGPGSVARPFHDGDQVSFRSGDIEGDQTPAGRSSMSDDGGRTRISDGRGGVRVVTEGRGTPDLRITEDHVRVSAPGGAQQRVDIPRAGGDDAPTVPRPDGSDGPTPRRDEDADSPTREGEDGVPEAHRGSADRGETDGSGDGGRGSSGSGEDTPVTPVRSTRVDALAAIPLELFKNALNITLGFGVDMLRYHLDWYADNLEFGPDGLPNARYLEQSLMQMGTAIPKAAAETRFEGGSGAILELSHQAMRNRLRDGMLEEFHEDFLNEEEREDAEEDEINRVGAKLDLLDKLLSDEVKGDYLESRQDPRAGPAELKEEARMDQAFAEAERERARLEEELAELRGIDVEELRKQRDDG